MSRPCRILEHPDIRLLIVAVLVNDRSCPSPALKETLTQIEGNVAFELLTDPERTVDLEIGELKTLDEVEAEVSALAVDTMTPLVLGIRLKSPPPFSIPEAVRTILHAIEGATRKVVLFFATETALVAGERLLPGGARPPHFVQIGRFAVWIKTGNIAWARANAVVNASSTTLHLGGGVSGAIRSAAERPDALQAAMMKHAPLESGGVVATPSFGLPHASTILHAATASGGAEAVRRALQRLLELADTLNIRTLALPALGTGTGGLSRDACAVLVNEALQAASEARPAGALCTVEIVCTTVPPLTPSPLRWEPSELALHASNTDGLH